MEEIVQLIRKWYEVNKRDIPWRNDPTGYHIWLSEIMCQQTRIETVIPYYLRFIKELPSIQSLANVDDEKLMKLWQGLGYYSRARNLKKSAQMIVDSYQGQFPDDFDKALKLKGIGEYTAGAILSIAYQLPFAAVDGNVLRVLSRVFADGEDIGLDSTKRKYKSFIEASLKERAGDFNQGMMDLGATICIPNGFPLCERCPLVSLCKAHKDGIELEYPKKNKNTVRKVEDYTVLLLQKKDKLLLHKRNNTGLLAGLYEPKTYPGVLSMAEIERLLPGSKIQRINDADFLFTHKKWHMIGYRVEVDAYKLEEDEIWVSKEEMEEKYSIPTAFREFFK